LPSLLLMEERERSEDFERHVRTSASCDGIG
jgi:hypothetical protein